MAYILGQYQNFFNDDEDSKFMKIIGSGWTPIRIKRKKDFQVTAAGGDANDFEDEAIYGGGLNSENNYYFHGKIQRMLDIEQTFDIKLVYAERDENKDEQFIKTIVVAAGQTSEWVDVEFIFNPLKNFNCILFELQRTQYDYITQDRSPKIAYQELSIIQNVLPNNILPDNQSTLIKLGIQSRPGLMMCINGEEIRACRTGIYEFKNGLITINFFSVVNAIKDASVEKKEDIPLYLPKTTTNPPEIPVPITEDYYEKNSNIPINIYMDFISKKIKAIDDDESLNNKSKADEKKKYHSYCFFGAPKETRKIDSFTLDYIYYKSNSNSNS